VHTPEQPPPLQPVKVKLGPARAERVIWVPLGAVWVQSFPQLTTLLGDVLVTVPVPLLLTVRVNVGVNVAVTVALPESVTVQPPVPLQPPPLQPVKAKLGPAAAARVTWVPLGPLWEQSFPQLTTLLGEVLVTVPVPLLLTVRVKGVGVNVAVTVVLAVRVTVQPPVPLQPPPFQPVKVKPGPAAAARVTWVPLGPLCEQSFPQLTTLLGDVLVTVPVPVVTTVSVTEGGGGGFAATPQATFVYPELPAEL
jgi:hypothetical protein